MTQREEKERMMVAELAIIRDMKELIRRSPEEGLLWKGTKQDLFQMIHILYMSEEVTDEYGVVVTFTELVRRFCNILHIVIPRNPRAYVRQSNVCLGQRRAKLLLRYKALYI